MRQVIWIEYQEIEQENGGNSERLPLLKDAVADTPQDHEEQIIAYLRNAPSYSSMGKVVRDVLKPSNGVKLYPGTNTDGLYLWPAELAYYVGNYHIRLPPHFVERMASKNWQPPLKSSIDYKNLYNGLGE